MIDNLTPCIEGCSSVPSAAWLASKKNRSLISWRISVNGGDRQSRPSVDSLDQILSMVGRST
jgi:hypothetical protein